MIEEKVFIEFINEEVDKDVYLEDYQAIDLYLYNDEILKEVIKTFKFKSIGSVFDYPETLPQPKAINALDIATKYNEIECILVSEKYNAAINYTSNHYYIACIIYIDRKYLKKFSKRLKDIIVNDTGKNIFRDAVFTKEKGQYSEIITNTDERKNPIEVATCKTENENLVFDKDSAITNVMNDILSFFQPKTKSLYDKLEIPYKRGIIIYGDPGNGKSAMIREIIRQLDGVNKIIISPSVTSAVFIIGRLVKELKGEPTLIVIEDMDSLITYENRSEFLNILDGVSAISGVFFIGTTNYPERIDPALMNRAGRFDATYRIDNPNEETRRLFFKSKKIDKILEDYKIFDDEKKEGDEKDIIELFVKYSENLPMASLKELLTSTCYALVFGNHTTIESAIRSCSETINKSREQHEYVDPNNTDNDPLSKRNKSMQSLQSVSRY